MGKISAFYTMPHPPIIIPEVGRGEEEKIKKTFDACNKVAEEIKNISPDTIIVVTPHGPLFSDAVAISAKESIHGNLRRFGASNIELKLDINISLTKKIIDYSEKEKIPTVEMTESVATRYGIKYELNHGTIIPLYFVNKKFSNYNLVHITYGMLSKIQLYKFGMSIKKAVEDSNINTIFIASGDLSHRLTEDGPYEYSPYGKIFDEKIISLLKKGDIPGIFNMDKTIIEKAGECGLRSYYIMLGAMEGHDIKGNLLAYEGIFGVGYSVMNFSIKDSNKDIYNVLIKENKKRIKQKAQEGNPYVKLARESLIHYLVYGDYMDVPSYVTNEMRELKRGVFVSLKKEERLRGCIGTVFPTTDNIAKEIIRNAVEAGVNDPRFRPITEEELEDIEFSVDVLTKPQTSLVEDLDPKKYGVIVKSGFKLGLLLPDLEGVDTVQQQLNIALEKGKISPDENYTIERFEVIRHR